jgi:hypothetical protein
MEWDALQAIDSYLISDFKNSVKNSTNVAKGKGKA